MATLPPDTSAQSPAPIGGASLGDPGDISNTAATEIARVADYTLQLAGIVAGMAPAVITPTFSTVDAPAVSIVATPDFQQIVWESPAAPTAFTDTLTITDLMPAPFDDSPPTLTFGSAPAAFSELAPDAPAINLSYVDPTLSISLPATPNLLSISVTPFDGVTMPTFTATDPVLALTAPSVREYVPGSQYTSALLTSVAATLQDRIENGGTGLNSDVENAIWDRGREREYRAQRDAIADLERMESLGYALPPGTYLDARIKITTETDYALRGHSREVMIKQAELEQSNVLAALQTAQQLEGQMLNYTNSVEQRLFDATKYATEAGISIYNAQVQAYASLVDVYKTKVQIYTAQIQAEMSRVEAYKAQIEAEKVKADVNTALVSQYKAMAEVSLSNIEIYKAQIAGIQTKAEIEKTKIEIYGEQVKAYGAKINAYTAGVEGFRATLQAEQTKQQVYQSQVEAYSAKVTAAAKQVDSRIAAFRGQIDAKNIELEKYKATVQGETARVQAIVSNNSSLADAYKAEVSGVSSYNEVLTKQWQALLDQNQRTAEIGISAAKANAELYVTTRNVASDAAKVGAQVHAQIAAAALNAINWSVSYGVQSSSSFASQRSNSWSYSQQDGHTDSTSRATNYTYIGPA